MTSSKQASFLPFNALNEFMRPDYRQAVLQSTLQALPSLPGGYQSAVNRLLKSRIQVPGFRNSLQAPPSMKLKPSISAFEKSSDLAGAIVAAWAAAHPGLAGQVFGLLTTRGWDILPIDADRTKLPGFLTSWPAGEDFSTIIEAFKAAHPEAEISPDDISLMAVWLSGRLPMEKYQEPDIEG